VPWEEVLDTHSEFMTRKKAVEFSAEQVKGEKRLMY
jgi:hypothetical protein